VDTFNSRYGKGWHRENSFLTHHRGHTLGDFCYGFFPHFGHPSGQGTKYRATAEGPGVTPVVMWAADELRQHYDSGRLTLDEFESRLAEVHTARTRGALEHAFRQLPRNEPPA